MDKSKRLSKVTVALGVYIVISAAFMLQVRNFLFKALGDSVVVTGFKIFFILISILIIASALRRRLNLFKICVISAVFILGYLFALWQPFFSEKTHVLTYGLLGYLAAGDLAGSKRSWQFKNLILALLFVSLISALDEIFQGILSYRFCEARDFLTNIISGALGMNLFFSLKF
ncbi:MAG: VanZ family protein [Candidatus Omnitrophota bacterium]|nr:VanZ family protein [Candidatus Omnitrophota bacterium]